MPDIPLIDIFASQEQSRLTAMRKNINQIALQILLFHNPEGLNQMWRRPQQKIHPVVILIIVLYKNLAVMKGLGLGSR